MSDTWSVSYGDEPLTKRERIALELAKVMLEGPLVRAHQLGAEGQVVLDMRAGAMVAAAEYAQLLIDECKEGS